MPERFFGSAAASRLRGQRHVVAVVAAIAMVAGVLTAPPPAAADPPDPAASTVVVGLLRLSGALAAASTQPVLATDLPLTDVSVRDVLRLDTALAERVQAAVTASNPTLDTLDDIISDDAGILTLVDTAPVAGAPAGSREWLLFINLRGAVPVALRHNDGRLQFGAAELAGELAASLQGQIRLRYDASALPLRQFSVVGESELTTHAWSRPQAGSALTGQRASVPSFPAIDGFVEVAVEGGATIDTTSTLRLRDPNGRGALTTEDLQFGSANEMFALKTGPGADDVRVDLAVRSGLLGTAPHGTVTVGARPSDSTDPYAPVGVSRDTDLDRLTSLTRPQALLGFAQLTSALLGAESSVDAEIPMLKAKVTDLFSPANQLLDVLGAQAVATIKCGAANTSPPTGAARPGQVRYCQAVTDGLAVDADTPITWSSPEPGVTFGSSAGTVGTAPTTNVAVSGGGGFSRLEVAFTSGGTARQARSLVRSVQELGGIVDGLGLGGAVAYDATNQALEIALRAEEPDTTRSVATGGTGSLAPLTGLTGLCQAAPGSSPRTCPRTGDAAPGDQGGARVEPAVGQATLSATGRALTATFGIGLVSPAAAPVAGGAPPPEPVTYLKPGTGGVLWQIGSVAASLPTAAPLVARIGFLQVDVDVAGYQLTTTGTAAQVTVPTGDVSIAGGTVSDAVELIRLLGPDPAQGSSAPVPMTGTRGLTASAQLNVADALGTSTPRPVGANGTVNATWNDLAPGALPTVVTGGAYDRLRMLDLVPAQRGAAGPGTTGPTGVLVDPNANFTTAFGVTGTADNEVTRQLYDLDAPRDITPGSTAGTVCTKFLVVDARTLDCTDGPLATGGLAPGHAYVIEGDPTALRDVLIEDLAAVLSVYATPDAGLGAGNTLPLVDLRPDQISAARATLAHVVAELQEAAQGDTGTGEVSTLQGFAGAVKRLAPSAVTTLTLPAGAARLEFATRLTSNVETTFAPLRAATGSSQLRVLDGVDATGNPQQVTLPLSTESEADIRLAISLTDGASSVGRATKVVERVTGLASAAAQVNATLAGKSAEYGATAATTGTAAGMAAAIALQVTTGPAAGSDPWVALGAFRASLVHGRSRLGNAQTCAGTTTGTETAACLTVPLVQGTTALTTVQVALRPDQSSGGTGASLDAQPLAYPFLADGLAAFSRSLTDALDGELADMSMPLVGTDLDAGADIPAAVSAYGAAARRALGAVTATEATKATTLAADLGAALTAVTSPDLEISPVTVTFSCATTCAAGATVKDVVEVRAPIHIGGNKIGQKSPFRAGLAGLALDTNLEVPTSTDWDLTVTAGIRRGSGPFLLLAPTGTATSVDVLTEHVTARLPVHTEANCHPWDRAAISKAKAVKTIPASRAAASRCIDAFVGKLPSVLVDRTDAAANPYDTGVDATLTVAVTPGAGTSTGPADASGRVYLPSLFDKKLPTTTTAAGTGGLDLYFEAYASTIGFFDVLGTIAVPWTNGQFAEAGVQFGSLEIDAKTVYDILDAGYAKAKKWLAPLNPVVDVLSAPIPVASQLSELVGGPKLTTLTLLAKAHQAIALVINLLQFQQLIARLPGGSGAPELRDLGAGAGGSFRLPSAPLQRNSCTKTVAATKEGGKAFTAKSSGTGVNNRCDESAFSKIKRKKNGTAPTDPTAGKNIQKQMQKSVYFSLPSISVPVLEDAKQVYDLILGNGDTTLLYVDLGHIGGAVSVVRNFGPMMIGPVPVVASIGGSIGVDGRFAFGFDTRGLSKQIELLEPGDVRGLPAPGSIPRGKVFSDGFYIDDLEKGVDVPEIKFTFTITAGAEVSIGFAQAGIRGGIILDLSLDAFDPNADGKIYADEFAGSATGPDCAFNVSSGIEFFLQFYFHIDLFLFHVDKSFDIVRSPRIKLFEFNCEVTQPALAFPSAGDLWLTIGKPNDRRAYFDTTKETYTVRQLGPTAPTDPVQGTRVEVSAFNLVQVHVVPTGGRIRAAAGSNDDVVRLFPGQIISTSADGATLVTPVPFTVPATLDGGDGSDKLTSGDGADTIVGGSGNDAIDAGSGDDTVTAGAGNDLVDGGIGRDALDGGSGDDRLSGGPGADSVVGGAGADLVDGGAGALASQLFATTEAAVIGTLLDAGDLVVGGGGSDEVRGGDGSDLVVGGDSTASPTFTGTQTTNVFGVSPVGALVQVVVSIPTLVLPTIESVRADCLLAGVLSGTDHDEVTGGSDRDYVLGGPGSDSLAGGGGADVVCGRSGDDLLVGDGSDVQAVDEGADEILGGPGADRLYGSGGADVLAGETGNDLGRGGKGDDVMSGGPGSDVLLGEDGIDTLAGDGSGAASATEGDARLIVCQASTSVVLGGIDLNRDLSANILDDGQLEGLTVTDGVVLDTAGSPYTGLLGDVVFQNGRADLDGNGAIAVRSGAVTGDTGAVELVGITGAVGDGDCLLGGGGADASLDGQGGGDFVDAGDGDDLTVNGGAGADLVRGGAGNDAVHGDAGNDLLAGDGGDDLLAGGADDDVLRGSSGNDLLIGGSESAATADGRDELLGDGGDDVLAGGNATMVRGAAATSAITGRDVTLLATPSSGAGPDDQLFGGFGQDWAFGQDGDDLVRGGHDDDVVEGGAGADTVQGDDGSDLAIGGSSTADAVTLDRSGAGLLDGADTVHGDNGVDGLDGSDVVVGDNARLDPATGGPRPRWSRIRPPVGLVLFDLATGSAPSAGTSGNDTLTGGGGDDLLIGQSGDDTISGGAGNDAVEGNAGHDTVAGGDGDDQLVGGSWTGGAFDASDPGQFDSLQGEAGNDVLVGDNGTITPSVQLLDVPAPGAAIPAGSSGQDHLLGGPGDDSLFGQSGDDELGGGDGRDALEGDDGDDVLTGGTGDDTLTGGSSALDGVIDGDRTGNTLPDGTDALSGDDGDDVLAGDNARLDALGTIRGDGTARRAILLFDVEVAGSPPAGAGDTLSGGRGRGRDLLFGQGGNDALNGGDGDDVLEGNAGNDTLRGDGGEDDLIGGGSSTTGLVISGQVDRFLLPPSGLTDPSAAGLLDGRDTLYGGHGPTPPAGAQADSADVLLGDNGRITRDGTTVGLGLPQRRLVAMADTAPGATSGSDLLVGQAGDDELYGQLDDTTEGGGQSFAGHPVLGDVLVGDDGDDALVGDQGVDVPTPAASLGQPTTLRNNGGFITESVRQAGTIVRVVTLTQPAIGGDDVLVGGSGADAIHAGAGTDLANGGDGDDVLFGADGADALWGGADHDRIFGGAGGDFLDLKKRAGDAALWTAVAPTSDTDNVRATVNGADTIYGGSGADALQADVGDTGRTPGDRLVDWTGVFNLYLVCGGAYGAGKVQNKADPATQSLLSDLALATGSVGPTELGLVTRGETSPKYPGAPGNFVCETG